ncbi:hypothetical protein BDFB_007450 [Asbolus verrucosus]|uniref:Uncharacterized protein n=1 Tax=Asbolus verrucosus TaxID=1661398 RepID=A0A482V1B7_ASBVE|nr:hypothetical protein BDFB_007450 [Asbolus verrucosus]
MSAVNLHNKIDNNNGTPSDNSNNNVENNKSTDVPKDEISDVSPSSGTTFTNRKTLWRNSETCYSNNTHKK